MARANQPTWDFLAGGEEATPLPVRPPTRDGVGAAGLKQSTLTRADINTEEIRAQLRAAQYELDSIKQERELKELQHQQEIRDLQSRAEADFRRAQTAEGAAETAKKKAETLAREFQTVQDRAVNEKTALEKKIRDLKDDAQGLREELEEANSALASYERQHKHSFEELQTRHTSLQALVEETQQDLNGKVAALQTAQQRLKESEAQKGELENEVLRLKAQTGDSDTLAVIKKELSEQVTYIRKLEGTNREQSAELKQLRKAQKSVDVVEEEKRALEVKLRSMDDLRKELSEAQLQQRILQDEKLEWTSYLESQRNDDNEMNYSTPEQMAKAFMQERLERLSLVDKLGAIQPELLVKEENIQKLEQEKSQLQSEVNSLKSGAPAAGATAAPSEAKARLRLERQKNLMSKELEYLKAQLRTQEAEEAEFTPDQINEQHTKRIHELEDLAEQYRNEIQTLQSELANLEKEAPAPSSPKKRSREEDEASDERLGELQRKSRALQADLDKLQTRNKLLEGELHASVSQVKALKESSRTRVLELRNNPTAEAEAVKLATLRTLREENAALLTQLEGRPGGGVKVVPISTLENLRLQMEEIQAQRAQNEKKTLRLKQIWSAKSLEFREAVCSVLGWRLDFMPNGRVKATSILHPTTFVDGEQQENSIVFDGEAGTMKVSGGPQSLFAKEIRGQIEFWVEGRKEIPCFLAACTLEFYERSTRAQKM